MLDEHYRCPPEIIHFSNKYVYGDELKTMQWKDQSSGPSVFVDFSEQKAPASKRQASGKWKGIETQMFDRFLNFVEQEIRNIEKETGKKLNLETDVALCYFLLKNEPYAKRVKNEFLMKLNRGSDILDGAGAALQGKERDYIFYYWDVTSSNMMAFKQGDDELKRKGELNVLMSRPKIRAYHYLHGSFAKLDHGKASITDYLWRKLQTQNEGSGKAGENKEFVKRISRPGDDYFPWRRSSGDLMEEILRFVLPRCTDESGKTIVNHKILTQSSVVVGDPNHKVDLMVIPPGPKKNRSPAVGIVDISSFEKTENCEEEIVDYFFQLKRASPKIDPVFMFIHELADERARALKILAERLSKTKKS